MAHRHKMQKGGALRRSAGGKADPFKHSYTSPGDKRVKKEAESEKETEQLATGGGVSLTRAHGGAAKKRGDRFKKGGSVWSKAASGLRGKKAFADAVVHDEELHGATVHAPKAASDGKNERVGHAGKAKHQYAKGGKVKGFKEGGSPGGRGRGHDEEPTDDEDAEED